MSFRRELYVPAGGPDGGDGGRGGSVIFEVDEGLDTLRDFRHTRKYIAENGEPGGKRRCHGKDAQDLIIKVPEGTLIKDFDSGKIIADLSGDNRRMVILPGGRGGIGNMHYATSTMQAPKYAKPGQEGRECFVLLELKLIADVGLVGFPNAGKSTLLSRVSNARPKIANYPFTTIQPQLGVVDLPGGGFVMADIPGLIEGAAEGIGLGHDFLRHIERTKLLLLVLDMGGTDGRDPLSDFRILKKELGAFSPLLLEKPIFIAANKIDLSEDLIKENLSAIQREAGEKIPIFPISGVSGEGIRELLFALQKKIQTLGEAPHVFEREFYFSPERMSDLPYEVRREDTGSFVVEGPLIEKMLGYTNLESEKGFDFFQKFLKSNGILEELERLGIEDGDTVRMYGHAFDYYR